MIFSHAITTIERVITYARYAARYGNTCKARTTTERTTTYTRYVTRYNNTRKAITTTERTTTYTRYAIWYGDTCKAITILERRTHTPKVTGCIIPQQKISFMRAPWTTMCGLLMCTDGRSSLNKSGLFQTGQNPPHLSRKCQMVGRC